jgi:hypothetical protein
MVQLRRGRQIPIGVGDVAVTKIGRQLWQVPFDIDAVVIPAQRRRHGQTMAEMPNSAFAPECRVPENAERCRLGLDFS